MNYKIYEMVKPEHLQKKEHDGYYMKDIVRYVLEDVDEFDQNGYDSIEDAYQVIKENATNFNCRELTILPVIKIDYKGELDEN